MVAALGFWKGDALWWAVSDGNEIEFVEDRMLRAVAASARESNYIDVIRKRDVDAYWRGRLGATNPPASVSTDPEGSNKP